MFLICSKRMHRSRTNGNGESTGNRLTEAHLEGLPVNWCVCVYIYIYILTTFLLTLITPTISNTEAAMQVIIIAYTKNLSSVRSTYYTTAYTATVENDAAEV